MLPLYEHAGRHTLAISPGSDNIYSMVNTKKPLLFLYAAVLVLGCATRDNTGFQQFHAQTVILAGETAATLETVQQLSELNQIEAASDGDAALLENLVLERHSPFVLRPDSFTVLTALIAAENNAGEAAAAINIYTLLLAEATEYHSIAFEVNSAAGRYSGLITAAVATLAEHGAIQYDARKTIQTMRNAAPLIEQISISVSALLEAAANSVQSSYADMSARRQRQITLNNYPAGEIEELVELNRKTTAILGDLEALQQAWLSLPAVHSELMYSVSANSTSATLQILAERLVEVRKETP